MASGNSFVQSDKITELPPKTVERKNPPPVPMLGNNRLSLLLSYVFLKIDSRNAVFKLPIFFLT